MSRLDQVADDVTEIKVSVAKIVTTLEFQQKAITSVEDSVSQLKGQMETALIPIKFARWTLGLMGAASLAVGLVYGVIQVAQAVTSSSGVP